jgi:ribosome modulation factor
MNANARMNTAGKRPSEIYSEGLQAYACGMSADCNPYRTGSHEYAAWDQGWRSDVESAEDCGAETMSPVAAPTG